MVYRDLTMQCHGSLSVKISYKFMVKKTTCTQMSRQNLKINIFEIEKGSIERDVQMSSKTLK